MESRHFGRVLFSSKCGCDHLKRLVRTRDAFREMLESIPLSLEECKEILKRGVSKTWDNLEHCPNTFSFSFSSRHRRQIGPGLFGVPRVVQNALDSHGDRVEVRVFNPWIQDRG